MDQDYQIPRSNEDLFKECQIQTMRASGAGGQHVNTTDSAVRLIHLPSGIQVRCQESRSQHRNKEIAISLLRRKLQEKLKKKKPRKKTKPPTSVKKKNQKNKQFQSQKKQSRKPVSF